MFVVMNALWMYKVRFIKLAPTHKCSAHASGVGMCSRSTDPSGREDMRMRWSVCVWSEQVCGREYV